MIPRDVWFVVRKYVAGVELSPDEWRRLSTLVLIDRQRKIFAPGNMRLAYSDAERMAMLRFYRTAAPRPRLVMGGS